MSLYQFIKIQVIRKKYTVQCSVVLKIWKSLIPLTFSHTWKDSQIIRGAIRNDIKFYFVTSVVNLLITIDEAIWNCSMFMLCLQSCSRALFRNRTRYVYEISLLMTWSISWQHYNAYFFCFIGFGKYLISK